MNYPPKMVYCSTAIGRPSTEIKESTLFLLSENDATDAFNNCKTLEEIAERLGLSAGTYSEHGGARLILFDRSLIDNPRYSEFDMLGSNQWWTPGLRTSGGQYELVVSRVEAWNKQIKNGNIYLSNVRSK